MFIKERQYYHRQAKLSAQAWAKVSEVRDKMMTTEFTNSVITDSILRCADKALSINRYDVEHNDQDRSIHRFASKDLFKEFNLPLCITFKDPASTDTAAKTPAFIIHLISNDLGFISSKSEEASAGFLRSIIG